MRQNLFTYHIIPAFLLTSCLLVISFVFITCGEEERVNVESARSLYDGENYDEAINQYREILVEQPDNVDAHVGLGWAYLQNNNIESAKETIEKVITLDDSNLEANVARVGIYLASSPTAEINRFKLAIKAAKKVLEQAPEDYVSQYDEEINLKKIKLALAQAYLYDGQIEQARKQMSELSEKNLTDLENLIDEISKVAEIR